MRPGSAQADTKRGQTTLRRLGDWLYQHRTLGTTASTASSTAASQDPITILCVSDTHTTQPVLPEADVLLYAGDLSQSGSFEEIQLQLDWLQSQPHRYKVVIGGNHDLLLDPEFVDKFPQRILERPGASRSDLKWGSIVYLQNSSVKLDFANGRSLNIYGSPLTKQFGAWAFQYPPIRDVWSKTVPTETDILLTHGPPWGYLDNDGAGSEFLLGEIWRVRPRMVVFGHIHAGYGKEVIRFDRIQKAYDALRLEDRGIAIVIWMGLLVFVQRLLDLLPLQITRKGIEPTILVNAAAVGGSSNQHSRPPVVTEL